jgi:hypothetical protein
MQFDRGYLSPTCQRPERMECVLKTLHPIHEKDGNMKDLLPVLEQIARAEAATGDRWGSGRRSAATLVVNKLAAR